MALTVTAGDLEALRFCESDEARSIVQNIAVILTTAKGTAPGDREFGVDMSFLDLPLPVAQVRMIAAVREAGERRRAAWSPEWRWNRHEPKRGISICAHGRGDH